MDAVEFFKTVNRLCKNKDCKECPVYKNNTCCMVGFDDDSIKSIEETVSKVEQWAKDHPVKTRQSEFLKQFPNAKINSEGVLTISPCFINSKMADNCKNNKDLGCVECRRKYWLEPIGENDDAGCD